MPIPFLCDLLQNYLGSRKQTVSHRGTRMVFHVPNSTTSWRARLFSKKEPDTLEWIDSFPPGSVLWDIGANIGTYAVYAGLKGAKVTCFEPSIFNLEVLAKNLHINGLADSAQIVPLPLADRSGAAPFRMSDPVQGSALSTFRETYGADGHRLKETFSYQVYGISLDDFVAHFDPVLPDYVKLDVDGIEHLVIKGGLRVLSTVREILVEISPGFLEQKSECEAALASLGFSVKTTTSAVNSTSNVIWQRKTPDAG